MKKSSAAQLTRIDQFMTPAPHVIRRDASLAEAQRLMRDLGARHLPVIDDDRKLVGMLSERDMLFFEALATFDPERVRVDRAMRTDVYGVDIDTPLDEVASTMASHKYGSAVVINGAAIVGIFTTVDAMRTLAAVIRRETRA